MEGWVKLKSFGGTRCVTGSCHEVTATINGIDENFLVDCGLFQGTDSRNDSNLNYNIKEHVRDIKGIFITHAHIDHIGRLPALYKWGYRGPIYATAAVCDLARIVLVDSANIQEAEYQRKIKAIVKSCKKTSETEFSLLYTMDDAENVMSQFVVINREETVKISDSLSVYLYDAGHALGSASVKLTFNNGEETFTLLFSGDLGDRSSILKPRKDSFKAKVDVVVMESTYAGRFHPNSTENWERIRNEIARTILDGGKVIIPAFAVGRTQEILYLFYKDMNERSDIVASIFRLTDIYIDSFLAVKATHIFKRFPEELKDEIADELSEDKNLFDFERLHLVENKESSIQLCKNPNPCIIFSAAGMCDAGRILFHLLGNLDHKKCKVIFTGYQSDGTLGRRLLDGTEVVNVLGEEVIVKANIDSLEGYSAHADQDGLLKWLKSIEDGYTLILNHGNSDAQEEFKNFILKSHPKQIVEVLEDNTGYYLYKGGVIKKFIGKTAKPYSTKKKSEGQKIYFFVDQLETLMNMTDNPEVTEILAKARGHLKKAAKSASKASRTLPEISLSGRGRVEAKNVRRKFK